jgi:hypothetical protein
MTTSAPTTPTKVLPAPPTYSGPREVLVNRPVTLKGTYDASRIVKVMVSAEDRVLFKVSLSQTTTQGTWQADLAKGFSVAGARWLRMRGFDRAGKEVENRVFYVTVSTNPLTVGQALTLKVLQDTYFKVSSQDSAKLNSQQKMLVKAGQVFNINRYGLLDSHLKVELASEIAPIGGFGYFYEQHVQMSRGTQVLRFDIDDVPDQAADGLQLLISTTTFIKQNRRDSSELTNAQKYQLLQGENLAIRLCLLGRLFPGHAARGNSRFWQFRLYLLAACAAVAIGPRSPLRPRRPHRQGAPNHGPEKAPRGCRQAQTH